MCGSRCLGPMTFNVDQTGQYVSLSQGGRLASRDASTFMNGLAFLSRTVKVDEKLCICIEDCTSSWDGALRVGFTNICPQRNNIPPASIPDLRDAQGYCVVPVPEDLCRRGVELQFWMNYAGIVIIQEKGGEKYYLKTKGLNLNNPLWVFIDLYGSTSAVRLLGKYRMRKRLFFAVQSELIIKSFVIMCCRLKEGQSNILPGLSRWRWHRLVDETVWETNVRGRA